jgi:uncharacterized phage-associated protein
MASAQDVAAWFLGAIDRKAGDALTNLKLQKLVYYAQAWALALLDRPLFDEDVEAWQHGPVVESVYQRMKAFGTNPLPILRRPHRFEREELVLLEDVLAVYGEHSAHFLEALTHQEDPWRTTRGDLGANSRSRRAIPSSVMRSFYRRQYHNRNDPAMKVDLRPFRLTPLEEGLVPLPPLPRDAEFPADHDAYVAAVSRDLASGPRRRRRPLPADA